VNIENGLDYILPIYDQKGVDVQDWIILMDSGYDSCGGYLGGGCVKQQQVNWLNQTFTTELHQNRVSVYFQLQPLPQHNELFYHYNTFGSGYERSCCPKYDTGLFKVLNEKNVHSVYVGHDHNNDYRGNIIKDGKKVSPQLGYGRKTGFGGYGPDYDLKRGTRAISLNQNQSEPITWIRTNQGIERIKLIHTPNSNQYLDY
jgi:pre-mRNA-splicing factor SYF1